jgi:hypothetical protein
MLRNGITSERINALEQIDKNVHIHSSKTKDQMCGSFGILGFLFIKNFGQKLNLFLLLED